MPISPLIVPIVMFTMVPVTIIGMPIARAMARRIDRQGDQVPPPADVTARLERIEQAVDAIAVEVERISEGQRFTTRLLAEGARSPAGECPAQP
jgi:hypothetical protein